MWDKYANNHKGICFGFDADKLFSVVGGGGEVIYADTLPEIDFINDDFTKKHVKIHSLKNRNGILRKNIDYINFGKILQRKVKEI